MWKSVKRSVGYHGMAEEGSELCYLRMNVVKESFTGPSAGEFYGTDCDAGQVNGHCCTAS